MTNLVTWKQQQSPCYVVEDRNPHSLTGLKITVSSESCHRYLVSSTPPDSECTWIPWLWHFPHLIPNSHFLCHRSHGWLWSCYIHLKNPWPLHGTTGIIQRSIHTSSSLPQPHLPHPHHHLSTPPGSRSKDKDILKDRIHLLYSAEDFRQST